MIFVISPFDKLRANDVEGLRTNGQICDPLSPGYPLGADRDRVRGPFRRAKQLHEQSELRGLAVFNGKGECAVTTYNFYLKDRGTHSPGVWGEGTCYVLGTYLVEFFDEICQLQSCPFGKSDFWWDPTSIGDTDLLIYFVDSKADSLVRKIRPNSSLGGGGTTHISTAGNLSEVYISAAADADDSARALAVLAFHEAMHNLLKRGNDLHGMGGMGLAAATVYPNSKLTSKNKELMAKAMGKKIPQNQSFL